MIAHVLLLLRGRLLIGVVCGLAAKVRIAFSGTRLRVRSCINIRRVVATTTILRLRRRDVASSIVTRAGVSRHDGRLDLRLANRLSRVRSGKDGAGLRRLGEVARRGFLWIGAEE